MNLPTFFSLLNRRQWLKVFLLGSAMPTAFAKRRAADAFATGQDTMPQAFVAELSPSTNTSAIIPIRLSEFSELSVSGGSVALYFSNVRNPIVINRDDEDRFYALDSSCTHAGCQVGNYDPSTSYMECDCHGSLYMIDGRVAQGPALVDLTSYRTQFDGLDLLEVELLGVPLRVDRVSVQSSGGGSTRLKLDFFGTSGCKYQVRYYSDLLSAPQAAMFALNAGGAANQTAFVASNDGPKSLWVDASGTHGFFAIEMVTGRSTPL